MFNRISLVAFLTIVGCLAFQSLLAEDAKEAKPAKKEAKPKAEKADAPAKKAPAKKAAAKK